MIKSCSFRNVNLQFKTDDYKKDENVFTIVVGRNGAGKSLLLRQLITNFVNVRETSLERMQYKDDRADEKNTVCYTRLPEKIIASSTSPFDKFPVSRNLGESIYEYVGLKGLYSSNLSLSYMSRIFGKLVRSINENGGRLTTILNVFAYMGYHGFMQARMAMEISPTKMRSILDAEYPEEAFMNYLEESYRRGGLPSHRNINIKEVAEFVGPILNALQYISQINSKPRLEIIINDLGVYELSSGVVLDDRFLLLLDFGFLKLRDIALHKIGVNHAFRISDASSGEQCVLMALLGIASHIQDGALICIDEPEVCLHPEWQEKFIGLLIDSFSQFQNCHFVVATHSPQIVSNLSSENCYVLDIVRGETINARVLNNRSADFQLASVFGAPGFKNEYLTRELVSALGTLGSGMDLSRDRMDIVSRIIGLRGILKSDDPVIKLIDLLSDVLSEDQR